MELYAGFSCDMSPGWMEQFGMNVSYVGKSRIEGYRLCFRGDSPGNGKATLEEAQGSTPCVLWMINSNGEAALAAEFGVEYETVELPVSYCGFSTIKAKAFVLRPGKPLNRPGEETVKIIEVAYRLHCIPERLLGEAVRQSSA